MEHSRLLIRRFLNRKGFHAGAHVIAHVEDSRHLPEEEAAPDRVWLDAELTIADCGRSITLDFSDVARSADRRENALRKADILIDTLTRFRDALAAEADLAAGRTRHRRAER